MLIKPEVSDGIIAPGYTDEALEILTAKRKGGYNVVQIDPDYQPAPVEQKDVFGVTFEQGRNEFKIDDALLNDIVTEESTTCRQSAQPRPADLSDYTEVYAVQFRMLCEGRSGHRRGRRPAEPHSLHPSGGPEGGQLVAASAREGAEPALCGQDRAAPTGTTPSTCISPTRRTRCWPRAAGSGSSR